MPLTRMIPPRLRLISANAGLRPVFLPRPGRPHPRQGLVGGAKDVTDRNDSLDARDPFTRTKPAHPA